MISTEKLYAATNDGLEILALHYPEVREAAQNNQPFKARPEERTPSARVKLYTGNDGVRVWKMTDFGGGGRAENPIQIHMDKQRLSFPEAILDLASIFNVTDEINRSVNRPDVRRQAATAEQVDGSWDKDIDQEFSPRECEIMGPKVTPETLKSLHWYRAKHVVSVRNREAVYKYSNENYPIFIRECWFTDTKGTRDRFYKIYEPLNPEKQWRFQYQPAGKKPRNYINGLFELAAAWTAYNEAEEKLWESDPANEGKPYMEKKLPEAIICSGERDAVCVKSLGFHPIWFNSETYQVSDDEWKLIKKYVDTVYNIPDIDDTGRKKGAELALRFVEIQTIWLPEKLRTLRDNRGRPRKDFRDWMDIYRKHSDFRALLNLATPAKFWVETISKNRTSYSIDFYCLREFLTLNGFYTYKDESAAVIQYIKITGNIVSLTTPADIRAFVLKWAEDNALIRPILNMILIDAKFTPAFLEGLRRIDPDFTNYTETSQLFYFPTHFAEVTAKGIELRDNKTVINGRYVWEDSIIPHDIKLLPDMFSISHPEGDYNSEAFDIEIPCVPASKVFQYLINSSRLFWRKELEYNLADIPAHEAAAYRTAHRFDIAGPGLSPEEIQEQKQCLINKIFTIGYTLHRYKSMSRAMAPFVMDNVIGERDQCNGRSGKSFLFLAMSQVARRLKLSGRNPKLLENAFAFEQVRKYHDFVLVDDCSEFLPFDQFYDNITSDITINAKNISAYTLAFCDAPKFAFTTNYVPKEFSPSSRARMLFVVFSDYYHQMSEENDYLENRSIASDVNGGIDLFSDTYSETDWAADINFMMQCVKFYLTLAPLGVKIEPQLKNIMFRKHLRDMSENFRDWAESYFAIDNTSTGEHLDKELVREDVYKDFIRFAGGVAGKTTMQRFTKQLKGFVYTCEYIDCLNPADLCNSGSRIMRRIEDSFTQRKVQKEMIYLRTKKEAERLKNPPPPPPTQQEMPF